MNWESFVSPAGSLLSVVLVPALKYLYDNAQDVDMGDVKAAKRSLQIKESAAPVIQGLRDIGAVEQANTLQKQTDIRAAKVLVQPAVTDQRRLYGSFPYLFIATVMLGILGIANMLIPSQRSTGVVLVLLALLGSLLMARIEHLQGLATSQAAKDVAFYPKDPSPLPGDDEPGNQDAS